MKKDKIQHFIWGAVIAFMVGVPCYVSSLDLFAGLWGCLAGVVAGGVKEFCDKRYSGKWDWIDFLYTCIGLVLVMLFVLGLHFGNG